MKEVTTELGFAVDRRRAVNTAHLVKRKIRKFETTLNLSQMELEIFAVPDFANLEICKALSEMIDHNCRPSLLLDQPGHGSDIDFRTSYTCDLPVNTPFIANLDREISNLVGIDPRKGEPIQGQRYHVGQKFMAHYDACSHRSVHWPQWRANGGQRLWTVMLYLNEPVLGGTTDFPNAMLSVKPQTGMLLAWNNLDSDGFLNTSAFHQGCEVRAGSKYIVTKWYRENFFI